MNEQNYKKLNHFKIKQAGMIIHCAVKETNFENILGVLR